MNFKLKQQWEQQQMLEQLQHEQEQRYQQQRKQQQQLEKQQLKQQELEQQQLEQQQLKKQQLEQQQLKQQQLEPQQLKKQQLEQQQLKKHQLKKQQLEQQQLKQQQLKQQQLKQQQLKQQQLEQQQQKWQEEEKQRAAATLALLESINAMTGPVEYVGTHSRHINEFYERMSYTHLMQQQFYQQQQAAAFIAGFKTTQSANTGNKETNAQMALNAFKAEIKEPVNSNASSMEAAAELHVRSPTTAKNNDSAANNSMLPNLPNNSFNSSFKADSSSNRSQGIPNDQTQSASAIDPDVVPSTSRGTNKGQYADPTSHKPNQQ